MEAPSDITAQVVAVPPRAAAKYYTPSFLKELIPGGGTVPKVLDELWSRHVRVVPATVRPAWTTAGNLRPF